MRGQPKHKGQKIVINNDTKNITKTKVTIDPCVHHNFVVELIGEIKNLK